MTPQYSEWLPTDALIHPRFDQQLGDAVECWSERWLGTVPGYRASAAKYVGSRHFAVAAHEWRHLSSGISIGWNEELAVAFSAILVDATDRTLPKTARDKQLLAALAFEVFEDLAASVGPLLGMPANVNVLDNQGGGTVEWTLRGAGNKLPPLALRIAAALLVPARKAMIGSEAPPLPDSCTLADACADASLPVRAELGKAIIGWRDLQSLEIGDVVVLDRAMSQNFPLLTGKSNQMICGLKLVQDEGSLQLLAAN